MRVLFPLLIALTVAAAGCLGGESTQDNPPVGDDAPSDASYNSGSGESPVHIVDFNVTNDRGDPVFYEDDRIHLVVTIGHDGSTNATAQHYLTLRAADEVVLVKSYTLTPGESVSLERVLLPEHAGSYPVSATIAGERAEADLNLQERPRKGEWAGDDNATFRINAHTATEEQVAANVTLRNNMENDTLARATASLLCRTPDGIIQETDAEEIERPGPGNATHEDLAFSACDGDARPHGLRFEYRLSDWKPRENVVLFKQE